MRIRKLAAAAAVVVAVPLGAALTSGAQSANAAANLPSGCNDNLCMNVVAVSGNVATISMWANFDSFFGHFELQMPNHRVANSTPDQWFNAGRGAWTFRNWNGGVGQWCGTEWVGSNGNYSKRGYICFHA